MEVEIVKTVITEKAGTKFSMKYTKVIVICFILLLLGAGIYGVYAYKTKSAKATSAPQQTTKVARGEISLSVSGSGPVRTSNKYQLTTNVDGKIIKTYFKDGDNVAAGDIIYEIDDYDAQVSLAKLENSIAQAKLELNNNAKQLSGSTVSAPIDGEIVDIQFKEGDSISNNATLLTITDKSKLKITTPFKNTYRELLQVGQEVTINALDTSIDELYVVKGHISNIHLPNYQSDDGTEVYNVEAVIDNPGNMKEGLVANIIINISGNDIKSIESSTLNYRDNMTVKVKSSGIIEKLNVAKGQPVAKGMVLAELQNDDLILNNEKAQLNMKDLQNQLEQAAKKLTYYKITAPADGVIDVEEIKAGDSVKAGAALCTIFNYKQMEFDVTIDELDIEKIQLNQPVSITVDALSETEEKPLKGIVSKIAIEGTSSSGVTTYPVTILIEETSALRAGMNVNGKIMVNQKSDILYVPLEAVQKRGGKSIVMVQGASEGKEQGKSPRNTNTQDANVNANSSQASNSKTAQVNQNATPRQVETGISNEDYIEIVSGLEEGEIILLSTTTSNTGNANNRQGGGFPAGGMMPMGGGTAPRIRGN